MVKSTCEDIQSRTFLFVGSFLITESLLLICSDFCFFLIHSWKIIEIHPFLPGCPICWHWTVHNIFLQYFVYLCVSCFFSFISDFIYLSPLSLGDRGDDESGWSFINCIYWKNQHVSSFISYSICLGPLFFLMNQVKGLASFFVLIFPKSQLFVSLHLYFSQPPLFVSTLIFVLSFLQLTLGLICSYFSGSCCCKVRLFETFPVSWGRPLILWICLIELLWLSPVSYGFLLSWFSWFVMVFFSFWF